MTASESVFKDVVVLDLGLGMAPALVTKYLKDIGATVIRVEPAGGDPFYGVYPAYEVWHRGKDIRKGAQDIDALAAKADIVVLGGEDFPGLERRHDARDLAKQNPRLVVLDIAGYPPELKDAAGRPASDLLVQARSGLCYEQFSDRPFLMAFAPSQYGAALHGLAGLLGALVERERSGKGQIVSTSLYEGALFWIAAFWGEQERPNPNFKFIMPLDPWPLIFKCSDGRYIHPVMGSTGSKGRLYRILEINDPKVDINDSGMPQPGGDPKNFFGDVDLLASYIKHRESGELLQKMWDAGMAAELVQAPGECWDDPQVEFNNVIVRDADGTRHVGNPVHAVTNAAAKRPMPPPGTAPLSGLTVVDMGAFVAGPYSSVLLGDLGADVIKIEVLTGDPNRAVMRSFSSVNRGKRSIAIDMKSKEGAEIARKLCERADIVTNNFRTGVSARLGVDAPSLHRLKPELIVLESPGYGNAGPKAERAAYDMAIQAIAGHEVRGGGAGNAPLWNRTSMIDYMGGSLGAIAVLEYLYVRAKTGAGAGVSVPLLNGGIYFISELIQRADGTFAGADPVNATLTGYHPAEAMYQAGDGWIAIAARDDKAAKALADTLGLSALAAKPRKDWGDSEHAAIAGAVATHTLADLTARLDKAGVWSERCRRDMEKATLFDEALIAAGKIHCPTHPQVGAMRELGPIIGFSRSESACKTHTPMVGEHTRDILGSLGYSPAEIDALIEKKVVKQASAH